MGAFLPTLILAILLGLIPAAIARNKGRDFFCGGFMEQLYLL